MKNWKFTFLLFFFTVSFTLQVSAQPSGFIDQEYVGSFDQAVGLTFDDNGRMYVYEKGGKVWIVQNGQVLPNPLLNISEEVGNWRDFGMLGFVLDPNFLSNGYMYCLYIVDRHHLLYYGTNNYNPNSNEYFDATIGRITRFQADVNTNFTSLVPNSRTVLLGESISSDGFPNLHQSHGTGSLVFGTDGTLLASFGDGASYSSVDQGSASETYWQQAIDDGIITPSQNIGAYRTQVMDNLAGKLIRIDPETGDGLASNPFYDSGDPGSAASKIFALGLRNPCRMTLRPETGSHDPADGDPGAIYIGDVGWGNREELNVVDAPGLNFGWPKFEGMTTQPGYNNSNYEPDNHERAKIDWRNGTARGFVNGSIVNVGSGQLPGPNFTGNCSIGGVWYEASDFPSEWNNSYFHADYGGDWIINFAFDDNNTPTQVKEFKTGADRIVFIGTDPINGSLYYIAGASGGNPQVNNSVRKISFTGGNLPPFALASADIAYGSSPLTVNFKGDLSYDPNGDQLTYDWNFGDGNSSDEANPSHTFTSSSGQPTSFTVTMTVSDGNLSEQKSLVVSLNNTPPQIISTSIDNINTFSSTSSTTLNLNAVVNDNEHNNNQLNFEWFTELHHNNHFHAEPGDNNASTTATLTPVGCDGATYFYRIKLQVTDPAGLSSTYQKDIYPNCTGLEQTITFDPLADKLTIDPPMQLIASSSSGLPIIFHVISGPASITGNTLTLSGTPGIVTVRALQSGNDTYAPAIPIDHVFTVNPAGGTGLTGNYFNNMNFTNQALTRIDPVIDFQWGTGSPHPSIGANTFSVRWEGGILPLHSETYTFTVTGDDGVRLWVDDQLIVDAWVDQSPTNHSGNIALNAGTIVPIKMEYYENGGGAVARLRWSSASQGQQVVPQFLLFPEYIAPDTEAPTVTLSTANNTVDEPFEVNIDFNENVSGLSISDFNISNGTASNLSGSGQAYTINITPNAIGNISIQLPADRTQDAAGNGNTASNTLNVNYTGPQDIDPPSVTLSTASNNVNGIFEVVVSFNETVNGLSIDDFNISNGTAQNDLSNVGLNYYFSIEPINEGLIAIQLPENLVQDNGGNGNTASNILNVNYTGPQDIDPPSVTLSTVSNNVNGIFEVVINFNEAVSGLSIDDFNISNATASDLSGSGQAYTINITPIAIGNVSIQLPANRAQDAAGNGNTASNTLNVNYTGPQDIEPPSVTLSTASNNVSGSFEVIVSFNETVNGLSSSDFNISNGTASGLSGSGQDYTINITPNAIGNVSIQLPADRAQDAAGNGNTASNTLNVNYTGPQDIDPPSVTLSTVSNNVNGLFEVVVNFNETVNGLSTDDFNISNGIAQNDLSNVGLNYYFSIEPINEGLVTIQLPANSVQDDAGNGNTLSNILNVNYTAPGNNDCNNPTNIALNKPASQSSNYSGSGAGPELAVDGNTNGNWYAEYSVSSTSWSNQPWWEVDLQSVSTIDNINIWNRTDCCEDFLSDYYILISDAPFTSNNLNTLLNQAGVISFHQTSTASSPTNISIGASGRYVRVQNSQAGFMALAEVEVLGCENGSNPGGGDTTAPDVNLSTANNNVSAPFIVNVDFNESVSGLALSDFNISNGSASSLSGSGNNYSFTVSPDTDGTVSIQLPANSAEDAAGNGNNSSNSISVNYTAPGNGDCNSPTNVALNKPASVSTPYNGSGAEAELAVDGNTDGNWFTTYSVASTSWGSQPWWEVDLEIVYAIEYVNIWNRTDCCSDFLSDYYILVSDVPFISGDLNEVLNQSGVSAYHQTVTAGSPTTVNIGRTGRYVRVQNGGSGFVALAELEVMGCLNNNNGDTTPPEATLSSNVQNANSSFGVNVNFSEPVIGLANSDFSISNGSATGLNGSGQNYALVILPEQAGDVTITLPAGVVTDNAGNPNLVSNTITVNYDPPPVPTVVISTPSEGSIISGTDVIVNFQVSGDLAGYNAEHLLLTLDANPPVDIHNIGTSGTHTFTNVNAGAHTLTAQLADDLHAPLNFPESSDEVSFTTINNNGGVCDVLENLALNGTASQSSPYNGGGAEPELAIDGNTSGIWFGDYSVSSTSWEMQPWWEIDLGDVYNIEEINVWNRTDCCSDFLSNYYILVSDVPFVDGDLSDVIAQPGVLNFHQTSIAATPSTINIEATGRYVRIQNNGAGFVTLAEVEIMGCSVSNANGENNSGQVIRASNRRGVNAVLYPNPAEKVAVVNYETFTDGTLKYIIANSQGVIFKEDEMTVEAGEGSIVTDIDEWTAGPYIFYIKMEGYPYQQIPFVKIRD